MENAFEHTLTRLRESSLAESVFFELSNLHGQALSLLADAWLSFPIERRQAIISRLIEIAEADFEADFNEVFKICLRDEDPRVRAAAVEGLWEVEDVALVRPLVRLLGKDRSEIVREAAAVSLSRFALAAELGRLQPRLAEMVWDALWQAIHNPAEDLHVRRRAIESLACFDRPEVTTVIRRAYQDEESVMRISAVFAMGRSADEEWSDEVIAELESDEPEMRYEAARACGELQIAEAVPMLSRMAADPDLEVKLAAVWALGQIGGPEARRVLEICAEMGEEALREAAHEALDELDYVEDELDLSFYDFDLEDQEEDLDDDLEFWEDEDTFE